MKQLLIVNSAKALGAGLTSNNVQDLSGLQEGAICFFELGASTQLTNAAPTKNFGIALGRSNGQRAFIIPEVDVHTLEITKALPVLGKAFKRKFTFPTPVIGKEYTIMFVKRGTVPHERNTWTCSIVAGSTTPATEATAMKKAIEDKLSDVFTVSVASAAMTITAKNIGEQWEMLFADGLTGTALSTTDGDNVNAEPTIGDKAYIQNLASQCAAGKGFEHTAAEGREYIPGYPEAVENLVPNTSGASGTSTAGYVLFTLRFQVGRDSAKTRDEKVWQLVHIAVPKGGSSESGITAILPEGKFIDNMMDAVADAAVAAAG